MNFYFRCTVSTVLDNSTATVPVNIVVNAPVIISHSEDQVCFGLIIIVKIFT
jgi:hypothetical protein